MVINLKALKVRAPKREVILKIMKEIDKDGSGCLDRKEFRIVVERLLQFQSSRISVQLFLTVLCPITAGFACKGLEKAVVQALDVLAIEVALPGALADVVARLPPTLDVQLMCGLMMMSVSPALSVVDHLFSKPKAVKQKSD